MGSRHYGIFRPNLPGREGDSCNLGRVDLTTSSRREVSRDEGRLGASHGLSPHQNTITWADEPRTSSGSTTHTMALHSAPPPPKLKLRGLAENQN